MMHFSLILSCFLARIIFPARGLERLLDHEAAAEAATAARAASFERAHEDALTQLDTVRGPPRFR